MMSPQATTNRSGGRFEAKLIGRERELGEMVAGLDLAASGQGRAFLIGGVPGVGKTRLATELTQIAEGRGFCGAWGRCWEGGGAPPLWPWTQILREIEAIDPDRKAGNSLGRVLEAELTAAGAIADTESARFQLFDNLYTLFRRLSATQPLLLILEDVHAADDATLELLGFLARELPRSRLLVVATYRTNEARPHSGAPDALTPLGREFVRLSLGNLTREDTGVLVCQTIGAEAGTENPDVAAPIEEIYRVTDGNPFFVLEVTRALQAERYFDMPLSERPPRLQLPQQVRETVRLRIAGLDKDLVEALSTAAVIGREFDATTLQAVVGADANPLLLSLDRAVTAGILTSRSDEPGRYAFSHALIREALYEELAPGARAARHVEVGTVLEAAHARGVGSVAAIAHHYYHGSPAGSAPAAVAFAVQAAEEALRGFAYGEAVAQWERALEVLDRELGVDDDRRRWRCELLLGLGDALNATAQRGRAREVFADAAQLARDLDDGELFARAALGYGGEWLGYMEVANIDAPAGRALDGSLPQMLREALDRAPQQGALRARLLSRIAVEGYFSLSNVEQRELTERAIELARAAGDDAQTARVLSQSCLARWGRDNAPERVDIGREVAALAHLTGQLGLEGQGQAFVIHALLELGDSDALRGEVRRLSDLAETTRLPGLVWDIKIYRAMEALLHGNFPEAKQVARDAFETGEAAQRPALLTYVLQLIALRRELAQLDRMQDALGSMKVMAEHHPEVTSLRCHLAFLYAELGRDVEARAVVDDLARDDFAALRPDLLWLPSMTEVAEACVHLRDRDAAAVLYRQLLPHAALNAVSLCCTVCWGSTSRVLGMLATLLQRWDDAVDHFEVALERNRDLEAVPWVAHTQLGYAKALLARRSNKGAVEEKVRSLLREALATARRLGMVRLQQLAEPLALEAGIQEPAHEARREAAAVASTQHGSSFTREGDYWTIAFAGVTTRLRHLRGLTYIAYLLRHAGEEVPAWDVVAGAPSSTEVGGGTSGRDTDCGEMIDAEARKQYEQRLRAAHLELEQAREQNDLGTAGRLTEEVDFLTRELARALGLGGRQRRAGSHAERARINVARAVGSALRKVAKHNEALGKHFDSTIRTGTYCAYKPDPRLPMEWKL